MKIIRRFNDSQWRLFFAISTILLCRTSPLNAQDAASDKQEWLGFGHNSSWKLSREIGATDKLSAAWSVEVGEGYSQVVGTGDDVYVMSGVGIKQAEGPKSVVTTTTCRDAKTGNEKWKHEHTSLMYMDQQTFGGATVSPRATPAIIGQYILSIGFTGHLHCLDRNNGNVIWKKDLVEDLGAEPVRFGFASSPIVDPTDKTKVCLSAAGESGGLYCLNVKDGSIVWKTACETFSYATPVATQLGGVDQWIAVTRNEVIGVDRTSGKQLWQYELPKPGLTNAPTPIVVNDSRLMVSGQGCDGTRCVDVTKTGDKWIVKERWSIKSPQFFYSNWLKLSDTIVVGCTDKLLTVIDSSDGSILGKWRGFAEGNCVLAKDKLIIVDGRGQLSFLQQLPSATATSPTGLKPVQQFKVIDGKSWTPVSIIGERMFVRASAKLTCLQKGGSSPFENLASATNILKFKTTKSTTEDIDPVAIIFSTFESKGQDAALGVYSEMRSSGKLNEDARVEIAQAAAEQGLSQVAKLVLGHALEDFPQSSKIKAAAKALKP